ncbi:NAD dependent epimerase/dehydratase [Eubacterium limosum]|nr:NAD dependent epimerase/dehydratase [Eubacterium limosum]
MKHILITGKDSYIGTSFEKWMSQWPEKYGVDIVDTITDDWKKMDFSKFDVILHVAAIVHKKEKREMASSYRKVNSKLPVEIAQKAKNEGVKQFVFMSTMSVYGLDSGFIDKDTPVSPKSLYGKSKLEAEKNLKKIENIDFKVVIIRPPIVYGKSCKGNYTRLSQLAVRTPVFPKIKNQRSMIYIDNLCEFIRLLVDKYEQGIFCPQNKEYVDISFLFKRIAEIHEKKVYFTQVFNPIIFFLSKGIRVFSKLFRSLIYAQDMSNYLDYQYCVKNFEESIIISEGFSV